MVSAPVVLDRLNEIDAKLGELQSGVVSLREQLKPILKDPIAAMELEPDIADDDFSILQRIGEEFFGDVEIPEISPEEIRRAMAKGMKEPNEASREIMQMREE
jgi:hypothetical protein